MITIYFNEFYEGKPYLDKAGMENCFGVEYCGESGFLQILALHGGITPPVATESQRQVAYYTNMLKKVKDGMFSESFKLDPLSVSNAVLSWRDTLVAAGWDIDSGDTEKLKFIREMEPTSLPKGIADCWNEVLRRSKDSSLLPKETEIVVTQPEKTLSRKMEVLFSNLREQGVTIKFTPDQTFAEGDLGMVQKWLACGTDAPPAEEPLELSNDGTFRIMHFDTDDQAMKYVASQSQEKWDTYLCQQPKQFDNILRYLGQPVCGSYFGLCSPQVVQLFAIGNGLFEKPLNLNRILAWLESPITPVGKKNVNYALARVLAESGGINNEEWENVVSQYLESFEDERDRKAEERNLKNFMPFLKLNEVTDGMVRKEDVIAFNKALHNWAKRLLSWEDLRDGDIVREQLGKLAQQCECLIGILQSHDSDEFSFVELQNWCQSIVKDYRYRQYEAQVGCRTLVSREGNLHSTSNSLVWFCISDEETPAYPFDFLTEDEISGLRKGGVMIDDRTFYARRRNNAMVRTLMKTRSLTVIEAAKIAGKPVKRHPLMIQLQAALRNVADVRIDSPEMTADVCEEVDVVDNRSDSLYTEIEGDVCIPCRKRKESYSSLDLIIQHPFDYVCTYLAYLKDASHPSLADVERTMGNVAHKIIEKVFGEGRVGMPKEKEYDAVFNEAVDAVGLMLRQPEYTVELGELRSSMARVLRELKQFIDANGLRVDGCEVELDDQESASGCVLGSRADMLLSDAEGKIVLDFKWTNNKKKYSELVATGTALQLSIYKWLVQKQYDGKVRAAYVLLPSMTVLSADQFKGTAPVETVPGISDHNVINEVFNGYEFRLNQFKEGRIERAEGLLLEDSEYGAAQAAGDIFPLKTGKGGEILKSLKYFKELR